MQAIRDGDLLLVTGSVGDHGTAIMLAREEFGLRGDIQSDAAPVAALTETLLQFDGLRFMRDPTRGGLASVAHELARGTGLGVRLNGRVVAVVAAAQADAAVAACRELPGGTDTAIIGEITARENRVILETDLGGERFLEELEDDPLPRIC
jgi:hydrogenase expression/formation protein HypE